MFTVLIQKIKTYFTAGLLVIIPAFLSVLLIMWFIDMIDQVVAPLISSDSSVKYIQGVGIVVSIVIILGVGAIVSSIFGKWIVKIGEKLISHIPFLRTIYSSSKTILSTVLKNKSGGFNQAVLVQYPMAGSWVVGFITGDSTGAIGRVANMTKDGTKHINVFVPTTPNPTSGMLLIVDKKDVKRLNMSVEDAVKFVITAGIADIATLDDAINCEKADM